MPRLMAALISAARLQMPSTPTRRFAYRLLCCWPLMVLSCDATGAAHAGEPRTVRPGLASAETAIAVVAGDHSPRLSSLSLRGATTWTNRADVNLPAQVEVRGSLQPLTWHLDCSATRVEAQRIEFIYVADSPRLRLVWQWRARGGQGPIEHSISIQNLGAEPVWLPLLPSTRFDWQVDPGTALARFWVEKGAGAPSPVGPQRGALRYGDTC